MALSGFWGAVRERLQGALAPYPSLYFPFEHLVRPRGYSGTLCAETEVVIEGFPRSANSWSVVAFREAQPRAVRIAHHRHAEAQVLEGVRRGLPVLVLIRQPEDAIRSLVHRNPRTDPNRALARWIAFYKAVERVRDEVVVASFEQATAEFGSVVERLNSRFGCRFETCPSTAGYREKVFAAMERDNADRPAFAAVPDARRSETQNRLELGFDAESLREAHSLYRRLAGEAA